MKRNGDETSWLTANHNPQLNLEGVASIFVRFISDADDSTHHRNRCVARL